MALSFPKKAKTIFRNILSNRNICIIGIDGTGKTSITKELVKILPEGTKVQYMGHKQNRFDLGHAKNNNVVSSFKILTSRLLEMWTNVMCHWPNEHIVIYDRYAWDRYIHQRGLTLFITKTLFKTLFPRPKYIFYLHCPVEVSLERKDDILDPEEFRLMKEKFDTEYLGSRSITAINTNENDLRTTIDIMKNALPRNYIIEINP